MPTREQIVQLRDAAQDILDGRDFGPIQAALEEVATAGADIWHAGRLRKTPIAAALAT